MAISVSSVNAAESGISVYGVADAGVVSIRERDAQGVDRRQTGLISGGYTDSLWGIQGREDLGHGFQAVFTLESGFDMTTGKSDRDDKFFDKAAWAGLFSAEYGDLRFGRQETAAQQMFSQLEIASWEDMGLGATFLASDNFQLNNSVNYFSPAWQGFSFGLGYSFDMTGNSNAGRASTHTGAAVQYNNAPWLFVASWDQGNIAERNLAGPGRPQAWQLGVSYDFQTVKVSAAWSRQKNGYAGLNGGDPDSLGIGLGTQEFANGGSLDAYLLGVAVPVGAGRILAQWSMVRPRWTWSNGEDATTGHVATLGYVFNLSKRTQLYAMAGATWHYSLDQQIIQGQGPMTRYMVGLHHSF